MIRPLRVLHLEDSPRDAEVVRHKLDAEGVSCEITLVSPTRTATAHYKRFAKLFSTFHNDVAFARRDFTFRTTSSHL